MAESANPRVSVVLIFYNADQFLAEAIGSVLQQTYNSWELLLVDDGAIDRSTEIALDFVERFPTRTRYLCHENRRNLGKSVSRNLGIRQAMGEYVAFLDADDVWLPQKLQQQVALLESQPEVGMLYGRTQYWYSWTGKEEDRNRDSLLKLGVEPDQLIRPAKLLSVMLRNESVRAESTCPYPSSVMIRRQVIEKIGGFEESFRDLYDDVVFFAKAFLNCSAFVANRCWDRYRMHPNKKFSASYSAAIESGRWHPSAPNPAEFNFLTWLKGYLIRERVRNIAIWSALIRCLLPYYSPMLGQHMANVQRESRKAKRALRRMVCATVPIRIQRWLGRWTGIQNAPPPVGNVNLGNLRSVQPISRVFGFERGQPIDRYYIERFLANYASDIQGRVLEVGDNGYTCKFGREKVTQSDILHAVPGNPVATIIGDLSKADHILSECFDCIILTQTLLYVYDLSAAVATVYRILKPGGVVLVTLPGICRLAQPDIPVWNDYWRFTSNGAKRLFEEAFPATHVMTRSYGNVLAAIAFLKGMASQELRPEEMDYYDPDYQVSIALRAQKPAL